MDVAAISHLLGRPSRFLATRVRKGIGYVVLRPPTYGVFQLLPNFRPREIVLELKQSNHGPVSLSCPDLKGARRLGLTFLPPLSP